MSSLENFARSAIADSELSQYRISLLAGCDPSAINRFVNGKKSLSSASLSKILSVLEAKIETGTTQGLIDETH